MWFECKCGERIHDNSDYHYNKAYFIPDKKWIGFWCDIDDAIEKSGPTAKEKDAACMSLRYKNYVRLMYQCANCGRIYINDQDGKLNMYEPESEKTEKKILDATT